MSGPRFIFVLAVLALGCPWTQPARAQARAIGVSAPVYESPGGTVPTIVTAYDVPPSYVATISARGTGGAIATCSGAVWINRIRRSASRKCYLRLPNRRGSYHVIGRARLVGPQGRVITRLGSSSRAVIANGFPSRTPMPLRRIREIERCFNATDRIWLTFDDGGSPTQVRRILATLARNRTRGRFFFTGAWAERNPTLIRQMRSDGHLLANHSYDHSALSRVPAPEVARQLNRGIRATTEPKLLRPPFAAGALTTRLRRLAAARGYRLCRWTVDTYDWQGPTAARMVERIRHGDFLTPPIAEGGNILMHGTGLHTSTGLQRIIDAVRAEGLVLDRLPARRVPSESG